MARIEIPDCLWVPGRHTDPSGVPNLDTTFTLDAANKSAGYSFCAPATGSLTDIFFATGDTFVTPATVDVQLQSVSGATGNPGGAPTGSLFSSGTNGTAAVAAANTGYITTLGTPASVTAGEPLGIVIANPGTSFGNFSLASLADDTGEYPLGYVYTSSWAKSARTPNVAVKIGGQWYSVGVHIFTAIVADTFNSGSTPNHIGVRFRFPWPTRIKKFWLHADFDGDAAFKLYDTDGASLMASSLSYDSTIKRSSNGGMYEWTLPSAVDIEKDEFYRLAIAPSSGTNLTLYSFLFDSAVSTAAPGLSGTEMHYTSATNPAAEGDWTNVVTKRLFVGMGLNAFDDGSSGGGGGGGGALNGFVSAFGGFN